jgi:hypothetical protein
MVGRPFIEVNEPGTAHAVENSARILYPRCKKLRSKSLSAWLNSARFSGES